MLAALFIIGGIFLPVGIFLIHYVGLAYSPFSVIGWASVVADAAGRCFIVALARRTLGILALYAQRNRCPDRYRPFQTKIPGSSELS